VSSGEKPGQRPASSSEKRDPDKSDLTPSLPEVDAAWGDDEDYDEDATRVAKVPHALVALSRRGPELGADAAPPEKHEAITARPPPMAEGEASVVVSAPHQQLPAVAADDDEAGEAGEEDDDDDLDADELDAGWDIEEEKAAAADVAAGLDPEARRRAAEERATARREKGRAKALAAKEKRKARAEAIRQKQKKPKKRSIPPPRDSESGPAKAKSSRPPESEPEANVAEPKTLDRTHRTTVKRAKTRTLRDDVLLMVLVVAIVVAVGALTIGLMRR
jgi:hypothetical protein